MENNDINIDAEYEDLQRTVKRNKKSRVKKRQLDFDDGETAVGWLGKVTNLIHEYGIKKVFQAIIVIVSLLSFLLFFNALDNEKIVERLLEETTEVHAKGSYIREEINPKVHSEIIKLLYEIGADRVSVMEMHNGKENPTSLPFKYFDMTYEETIDSVDYISEEYENLNLSKFSFSYYICKNKIFIGSIEEIYNIDKKLAIRFENNDIKYAAIIMLNTNVDIGFLMVNYNSVPNIDRNKLMSKIISKGQTISNLLDYEKQIEIREENKRMWK